MNNLFYNLLISFVVFLLIGCDSPNSKTIIFEKWVKNNGYYGTPELWSVQSDGQNLKRLTSGGYETGVSWSPDRTRIAFYRLDFGIRILNLKEETYIELPITHRCYNPQWIDNDTILVSANLGPEEGARSWRLLSIKITDRSQKTVDTGKLVGVFSPIISPDRKLIAFSAYDNQKQRLYISETEDISNNFRVISSGDGVYPSAWTPDSKAIIGNRDTDCLKISITDGIQDNVANIHECNLSWSPSGSHIVFQYNNSIWIMRKDGSDRNILAQHPDEGGIYKNPIWQ